MKSHCYDFLIIGQGLAGSILANKLINRGQRVLVVDNQHHASSSMVAAGIINPLSGKRLSLSDHFAQQYSTAQKYYQGLEQYFDTAIIRSIAQHRLISDQPQMDCYRRRRQQATYQSFLGKKVSTSTYFRNAELGMIPISGTLIINATVILTLIKQWLIDQQSYQAERVDYRALGNSDGFRVGDHHARQIIFCEGWQTIHNPWLKKLPFNLAKGEILCVEVAEQEKMPMLNWGHWLLPGAGRNSAILGATFDRQNLDLTPSKDARKKLLDGLGTGTTIKATATTHNSGIRPATKSRQPIVGALSDLKNAWCFNGFGSKGCLLIPHFADLLCDHLLENKPLPPEITRWL